MEKYLHLLSQGDKIGLTLIRLSIAIVFMWIGLLKFVPYEDITAVLARRAASGQCCQS